MKSVHEMARSLVKHEIDVTVFTTSADGPDDLNVPLQQETVLEGVKVWYFPAQEPRSFFRSSEFGRAVKKQVTAFDLVHLNWLYVYPTLAAARACLAGEVPFILSPRGMLDPHAISLRGRWKKVLYLKFVEGKHLRGARAVHFTSDGERDQALSAGWRLRAAVVPNGLSLEDYREPPKPDGLLARFPEIEGKRCLLFLGRLNYIKGLDLLARAWPLVVKAVSDAHLLLAGPDDGGYGNKVRSWLREGNAEGSTTFTGMLVGEEKLAALHLAYALVSPSHLESFGMSIVEAMACGKPVVITDRVNIHREVETAGAGVATPCTAEHLARAIIDVLNNPDGASLMGARGKRFVAERFAFDVVTPAMIRLYDDVVTGRTR